MNPSFEGHVISKSLASHLSDQNVLGWHSACYLNDIRSRRLKHGHSATIPTEPFSSTSGDMRIQAPRASLRALSPVKERREVGLLLRRKEPNPNRKAARVSPPRDVLAMDDGLADSCASAALLSTLYRYVTLKDMPVG